MDSSAVQDHDFEVGDICRGPDDCQMVLTYNRVRFILVMTRPEQRQDNHVVATLFRKMDEAENDPDEMAYDRCLEDVREFIISDCKNTMYHLASSIPHVNDQPQSLEDFLHPITFYLRLESAQGHIQATELKEIEHYASTHERVFLPMGCVPQPIENLIPAENLGFVEDLHMGNVIKVSHKGEMYIFKSASSGNEDQLEREIRVLIQISKKWGKARDRPQVPCLIGLVTSRDQIAGLLETFVQGENLYDMEILAVNAEKRREWKTQIKETIRVLHDNGFVWGDAKAANILVDRSGQACLIDFGGSWTDGWVDEDVNGSVEGDIQGLQRIVESGTRHSPEYGCSNMESEI